MSTDLDVPPLSQSIWPYDTWKSPDSVPTREFRRLRCFVLCRFDRAGTVLPMVRTAAHNVEMVMNHQVQVYYAGDIIGSSAIHSDIWTHILQADMVIADITGYNPNVMYELGVAAAWRLHSTVMIMRDKDDGQSFAFDLQPARQIVYESSSIDWISYLNEQLVRNMLTCLAPFPFRHEPEIETPANFEIKLTDGRDSEYLWSPGPGHRRLVGDGLEFGSPYYFPYSWLSVPKVRLANVRVQAEMRFSFRLESCWMGIALRSQGYLGGNGTEYLTWVSQDGTVNRTGPSIDAQGKDEHNIGHLSHFDPSEDSFVSFSVSIDCKHWLVAVENAKSTNPVSESILISELPHVFPHGRIMFQTYRCRAVIRNVLVEGL